MNNIYNEEMINKARDFAYNLHANHTCIITGENKKYHLESVVSKIQNLNLKNDVLVILAYLHDTIDYVDKDYRSVLIEQIKEIFGYYIAKLVLQVTDNFRIEDISTAEGLAAFEARRTQIISPGGISDEAAKVILAEKVCNLRGMYHAMQKNRKEYWNNFSASHGLREDDVKKYYDLVYDVLAERCSGDIRLRSLINDYDYYYCLIFC